MKNVKSTLEGRVFGEDINNMHQMNKQKYNDELTRIPPRKRLTSDLNN